MSLMGQEIGQIPAMAADLIDKGDPAITAVAERLIGRRPTFLALVGRGSSGQAAAFGGTVMTRLTGVLSAPVQPSLASLHHVDLRAFGALALVVSQSGQSPDIVEAAAALRRGGAYTVAIVNDLGSRLAAAADAAIDQSARPERAVAATKSFVASLIILTRLATEWAGNRALAEALLQLPERLSQAVDVDWSEAIEKFRQADRAFVIGRGPGLAVAGEAALKLKETCLIQGEPFSSAEVRHGPKAIIEPGFRVLGFVGTGPEGPGTLACLAELQDLGADISVAGATLPNAAPLPLPAPLHPLLDPIVTITCFYRFADALAHERGLSPDRPRNLSKVTATL